MIIALTVWAAGFLWKQFCLQKQQIRYEKHKLMDSKQPLSPNPNRYRDERLSMQRSGLISKASKPQIRPTNQEVLLPERAGSIPPQGLNGNLKRACDCLIGTTALIVLSPIMIAVSILIRLDSKGPSLFCQQRRGRYGKSIAVFKFRTMYETHSTPAPTSTSFVQTRKDDPRVTAIGVFLRKTSLDELPQLINVIQGNMSLVGPRPHPMPLDEKFRHLIPSMELRYAVKPGITGWAQVNGFRGETARVEDMVARVEHDCHYITHWSLWLDLKIICVTAVKGWSHRNAY